MTDAEAIQMISDAVAKAKGKPATITAETHLIRDNILDSLDSIRFLFELEKTSGVKISEEQANQENTFQIATLCELLVK